MGYPMRILTACSLWFMVVLAVATGSGGDVISPTPDFAPAIESASPPNSRNLTNTVPAPPLSNMAPETEGIPPVIPIVSHTKPPAFSPDQLPGERGHSTNVPPPARAPSIPTGPADVSPSSSISAPPPLPQLENGPTNATQPNISPSASSPVPLALLPPTVVPPQLPISVPNISASPPFFHTAAPHNAPPPTNVPPPLPISSLNNSAPPPTFHGAVPTNGPVSSPKQSSPTVTRGQIKVAPAFSPSEVPTHLLPSHRSRGVVPVSSPRPPDAIDPPNVEPPVGAIQPQKGKTAQPPVLAPTGLSYRSSAGGAQIPSHPPMHLKHHWSNWGPIISPFPSRQGLPLTTYMNKHRRHAHPPISAPAPSFHPRSSSPVIPKVASAPSPSPETPSKRNPRRIHAPAPAPSSFTPSNGSGVPSAPAPTRQPPSVSSHTPPPKSRPAWVFPPPPPNLDCSPLTCMEPLTYSPAGSPCACVRPMKVGLRLTVELYSFFPLVSELAEEISSSTSMKQSQVRIMGANAGSEQPDKTIVLVDLVPLGERFDSSSAFLVYQKFWQKQVVLNTKYFGLYDVLYVSYPGLPPSPPMSPSNFNVDDGPFGGGNHSRPEHPLGVDVGRRKEKTGGSTIAIIVLSSAIASVLCAGAVWIFLLKRNGQSCLPLRDTLPPFTKVPGTGAVIYGSCRSSTSGSISSMATYSAKTFSAVEIEKATNKCDDANTIGEGGFGRVYQGTLEDGTQVAVKVLKRDDQQGGREFLSEVEMLSRLHHRNLVKLIGICTEEHLRCLVYELIPNGSVESHLHGPDKVTSPLDWGARMKIALGSARGLAYLHEDSSPRVIHRDFKSSNILLEHDFTAKVSDFGLARTALEEGEEHISTRVMGTFGYVAPEYAMTGHLLVKSDVYSYGVVLLELLSGRKPVDMLRPLGQENLVTWARPLLSTKEGLETLIDPTLGPDVPFDSVAKVAAIASMCIQSEVSHRPFMGEVVQALKLVCNGGEEHQASDSCSREDSCTHDPEIKTRMELAPDTGRMLSASEIFSMPMGLTRTTSLSFRRQSSSGPLKTTRRSSFWWRVRGLTRRSAIEHSPKGSKSSQMQLEGGHDEQCPL